ncbi:glycosyltransferase family A protein [Pseudoalteromonas tetraodonis]|uniref:glycosyltransferase family A protein n=1 Tax=Pseudoalteromonas tetraodonis TaxID=43659 RepID=UPI000849E7F7|nr:glycosyltransferase family A protein [Pseudoalteromonas tetraodonis]ODS13135.1 hypothetical protein BCD66_14510 [Pseudoalteromonas tetraodonis]
MNELTPYFTVFTPTYNRAHTLTGVYESLCNQTFTNFEWLIIDDGSDDQTELLVQGWQKQGEINIRYFRQINQGKHVAHNVAVDMAKGVLFLVFDSDDRCIPEALETFKQYWDDIPCEKKDEYSTISALCMNSDGKIFGEEYPESINDIYSMKKQIALRSHGDKWGVNTTKSMREYKFPVFPGEKFIPEGIVWNWLSSKYATRFINKPLKIVEYLEDGLTGSSTCIRINSPKGTTLVYQELLHLPIGIVNKLRSAINFVRFSFHGKLFNKLVKMLFTNYWVFLALPAGAMFYIYDKLKVKII